MEIGVGLPATLPGAPPSAIVEWAERAEAGPFASLGCLDRTRYDAYDPIVALTAAAAVTERIELVTSILIAPLRETATLAKQASSLDALSGGRLTLGVAIGARGDDYEINDFAKGSRGDRLSTQLERFRELWEEERGLRPTGAGRERPRLLVGGDSGPAYSRAARHADGWIHAGGPPRAFERAAGEARDAWAHAGRPGRPELWAMAYFGLGGAEAAGRDYLLDYYAFTGPFATRIAEGLLSSTSEVREHVQGMTDAGCDHLLLFPTVPDVEQLDLLAEVVA